VTIALDHPEVTTETEPTLQFLALDITRACQAACVTCYNQSGPGGKHSELTLGQWLDVIEQAAAVLDCPQVQFIGGEPTLHPDLPEMINKALHFGMAVEVFSNLIHVREALWPVLRQRGVTLATSWYSDQVEEHEAITQHTGSFSRTSGNIVRAVRYGIPVRGAVVRVLEGQRVEQAIAGLRRLGVERIRTDRVRAIGRGAGARDAHDLTELCGHCTRGRAAILPNGDVAGCVMSGAMMTAGNVTTTPLAEIITSQEWALIAAAVPSPAEDGHGGCTPDEDSCQPSPGNNPLTTESLTNSCSPDGCTPREDSCQPSPGAARIGVPGATGCNPNNDGSDCAPAESEACGPSY
jgi:sulfatase maturation enzyme AslB (radical SAM superfamily)